MQQNQLIFRISLLFLVLFVASGSCGVEEERQIVDWEVISDSDLAHFCSVCHEKVDDSLENSEIFDCPSLKHRMHPRCSRQWLVSRARSGHRLDCPMCRSSLSKVHKDKFLRLKNAERSLVETVKTGNLSTLRELLLEFFPDIEELRKIDESHEIPVILEQKSLNWALLHAATKGFWDMFSLLLDYRTLPALNSPKAASRSKYLQEVISILIVNDLLPTHQRIFQLRGLGEDAIVSGIDYSIANPHRNILKTILKYQDHILEHLGSSIQTLLFQKALKSPKGVLALEFLLALPNLNSRVALSSYLFLESDKHTIPGFKEKLDVFSEWLARENPNLDVEEAEYILAATRMNHKDSFEGVNVDRFSPPFSESTTSIGSGSGASYLERFMMERAKKAAAQGNKS